MPSPSFFSSAWKLITSLLAVQAGVTVGAKTSPVSSPSQGLVTSNGATPAPMLAQCPADFKTGFMSTRQLKRLRKMPRFHITMAAAAEKSYQSQDEYRDTAAMRKVLEDLYTTNVVFHCEFNKVFSPGHRKPYVIKLSTPKDLKNDDGTVMQYLPDTKEISVRAGIAGEIHHSNPHIRNRVKHAVAEEVHHAVQSARSRELKQNYKEEFDNSLAVPYTSLFELNNFVKILTDGAQKIKILLQQFRTQRYSRDALAFKHLVKNHTPHTHYLTKSSTKAHHSAWIKNGYADTNLNLKKPFEWQAEFVPNNKVMIQIFDIGKTFISFHVVTGSTDPAMTALMDIYLSVHLQLLKNKIDTENIMKESVEIDAHIHHLFYKHPKIIDALFPALRAYHTERMGEEYRACLQRF